MKNSAEGNRLRQKTFKASMEAQGFKQVQVWVPEDSVDTIRRTAEGLRDGKDMDRAQIVPNRTYTNAEPPNVTQFWNVFHRIEALGEAVNHSKKPDKVIAINLSQFQAVAKKKGLNIPDKNLLKRVLPRSKQYPLTGHNVAIASCINWKTTRCYLFDKEAGNPLIADSDPDFDLR